MKARLNNNETRDVVKPVLYALGSLGFYVVKTGKDFESALRGMKFAQWSGMVWRQNTGGMAKEYKGRVSHIRFCPKGVSDIVGIRRDGRWLAIEVKRPGGNATKEQSDFMDCIRALGGVAIISRGAQDIMERRDILVPRGPIATVE